MPAMKKVSPVSPFGPAFDCLGIYPQGNLFTGQAPPARGVGECRNLGAGDWVAGAQVRRHQTRMARA